MSFALVGTSFLMRQVAVREECVVSLLSSACSFLVMVPGHPEHGPLHLVSGLLNALLVCHWRCDAITGRTELSGWEYQRDPVNTALGLCLRTFSLHTASPWARSVRFRRDTSSHPRDTSSYPRDTSSHPRDTSILPVTRHPTP